MDAPNREKQPVALRALEPQFVEYGTITIPFIVTRMPRQRIAIEVRPNLLVNVNAPMHATTPAIREAVRSKAAWILRQTRYFSDLRPFTPERRFVSGESHLYLGRKYRLRIRQAEEREFVKLDGGYLYIFTNAPGNGVANESLLASWYRRQAERVFPRRVHVCAAHPLLRTASFPRLAIRRLKRRWGSCSPAGRLTLNLSLIRAPRGCIDYVITHELCHLLVPNHSSKFTRLLDRVMPDWRERKQQLERRLA